MTKQTTTPEIRTFIGKQIDLHKEVLDIAIKGKDSLTISVESVGGKDVLLNLGDGIKLGVNTNGNTYVNGDTITVNAERIVISEDLKPYVKKVSNRGASPAFERYE